jgi:hypothetical protein
MSLYQDQGTASTPIKVTVSNLTANGNILTAPTSVDIAQILEFNQTTASITGTLLNPTITTNYLEISVVNNGTADFTLASTGDSFVIFANKVPQKIAWSGTASSVWKLINPVQVSPEGFENLNPFTSGATTASLSYVDCPGTAIINIPSAGTWQIGYWANVVSSTVNAATNMCIAQTSGTALQGTESVWQTQSTNATGTVTGQKEVTTTGAATYRVQWKCLFGTSSRIGYSGGTNDMSRIWCRKVSGFSPVTAIGVATIGDAKSGFQTTDHNGWIKLDGRLKTALTTTQQANATALGIGVNLPDASGRSFRQGTLLANIGSSTILQTDLPNVTLTTVAGGNHTHSYLAANGSATLGVGSGSRLAGEISIRDNTATTTGTGAHTHTALLNGGVTQTAYTPASIGVNQFIYLGV